MSAQKPGLHPRNRHHSRYDLATLCQVNPELRQFLTLTPAGEQSVDFANPLAVKALNKALLAHFYAVANWDIPDGFLCPPVPAGRIIFITLPIYWPKQAEQFQLMPAFWISALVRTVFIR